ncbi:hypothetical protein FSARC_8354 [Fusarium sarcochroum]|uniref:Uncharacterized protein n=1 Tax=Fusarium sarcochroum TaxID=1208366 RepID=A0A8H4X7A1_9HYPO|nr:hypothetical protein FSARC_8354 [Fusarium sarcochroum]
MASDLIGKLKETLAPTGDQSHTTEQPSEQQGFTSNARNEGLESTTNQTRQPEGVRTGDQIQSLVENVPGVPSTQSKPRQVRPYTCDTAEDMHQSHHPADASRAPPSALKEHLGQPSIEHDYPHESSTKRHGSTSHQEEHYNLG